MLFCSGAFATMSLKRERHSVRQLAGFVALLRYVKWQIDAFSTPIPQMLSQCEPRVLRDCGIKGAPLDFGEALACAELSLPPTAKRCLFEFSAQLGGSYREEQLRLCEHYVARLQTALDKAREELPKRERLALVLPLSLAAALLLLFW